MRRTPGTTLTGLVGLLLLAGCGEADSAASPAASTPQFLSGTAAGGRVATHLTTLADAAAVRRYAAKFRSDAFARTVRRAASAYDVPDGHLLGAAVVSIGCDVPTSVAVSGTTVRPRFTGPSTQECLAPVTTVVLLVD